MKCVYKPDVKIKLFLKNGECIIAGNVGGRYLYRYGEKPEDTFEEYTDNSWNRLLKFSKYSNGLEEYATMFKKRIYINDYFIAERRIYKDELVKIVVESTYEEIENPNIRYLQEDLGFKGYSSLVFDRECELRKLMES